MAIEQVVASASQTGTSTTYAAINNLTLTPGAGNYLALAVVDVQDASGGNAEELYALFVNGTVVADSERHRDGEGSYSGQECAALSHTVVSPTAGQTVDVRYQRAGATPTFDTIMTKRNLTLLPLPGVQNTDWYHDSVTSDTTIASATFATLNGMSRTPGNGKYLLVFSASCETPSDEIIEFHVTVGGTEVDYTLLQLSNYSSAFDTPIPVFIFAEIDPNGSQAVVIEWRRHTGAGTLTCHERAMTLVKVDAAGIKTVSSTTTTTVSTTTTTLVNSMTHTDPGDKDWLVLFAAWQNCVGGATDQKVRYYLYKAGAAETDGDRGYEAEESTNEWEYTVGLAQKITVAGATDEVEIYWSGTQTRNRSCNQRSCILVAEISGNVLVAPASLPVVAVDPKRVNPIDIEQTRFRVYADDASEGSATPLAAENIAPEVSVDTNIRIRNQLDATGNPPGVIRTWQAQRSSEDADDDDAWYDIPVE